MRQYPRSEHLLRPTTHWWHRWRLSTQKFAVILSITAFGLGFGYVLLTNNTAAEGFAIKRLEQSVAQLREQNEKLELKAADLRSLSAVRLSSAVLQLEPAEQFEYLAPTTSAVAVRP